MLKIKVAYVIRLFRNWTPGKPFVPMQWSFISKQSEAASVLCKPIGAKHWPSTSSRPTISTSHLALCLLLQNFMECAGTMRTFFYLIPILRQFRIVKFSWQAALHSALFNQFNWGHIQPIQDYIFLSKRWETASLRHSRIQICIDLRKIQHVLYVDGQERVRHSLAHLIYNFFYLLCTVFFSSSW